MNRLDIAQALIPSAAALLRMQDANNTGMDDIIADLLDFTNNAITSAKNRQGLPKLPESLMQAFGVKPVEPDTTGITDSPIVSSAADAKALVEEKKS